MRNLNTGFWALTFVGGYFLWKNRFKIQEYLEAQGLDIPMSTDSISGTVKSGIAKVKGSSEHTMNSSKENFRQL